MRSVRQLPRKNGGRAEHHEGIGLYPIRRPQRSIGGLIGGEAKLLRKHKNAGQDICGCVLSNAITYAMAVLEVNTSMGLIVAAPTAGSSGIVPGLFTGLAGRVSYLRRTSDSGTV